MRISFDIDETIICSGNKVLTEPNCVPWIYRYWYNELLRLGTKRLMEQLITEGWEIALYTTSFRSPSYLQHLLKFYGIKVGLVINQEVHNLAIAKYNSNRKPSKLPALFQIDLHVDDSDGVLMEGREYKFDVVIVKPSDINWTDIILEAACRVKNRIHNSSYTELDVQQL
jgi:hypothetical protein